MRNPSSEAEDRFLSLVATTCSRSSRSNRAPTALAFSKSVDVHPAAGDGAPSRLRPVCAGAWPGLASKILINKECKRVAVIMQVLCDLRLTAIQSARILSALTVCTHFSTQLLHTIEA